MTKAVKGWHFTRGLVLRDGTPLEVGRTYAVGPPLALCRRGLHASVRAIDALRYAPGAQVSRVILSGDVLTGDDKLVASERRVLWTADATRVLREFAIAVATDALELVDARGGKVDARSRNALKVAADYLVGAATRGALLAAQREAWAARCSFWNAAAAAYATAADAAAAYATAAADAAAATADAARRLRYDAMNEMLTAMLASLAPNA